MLCHPWPGLLTGTFSHNSGSKSMACNQNQTYKMTFQVHGSVHRCNNLNKNANQMYFVLKSLKFIYIIPLYMFRTPLCPSSGASQMHMQSLVRINYKNKCCLQICHYVHFIITTNYLCDMYN